MTFGVPRATSHRFCAIPGLFAVDQEQSVAAFCSPQKRLLPRREKPLTAKAAKSFLCLLVALLCDLAPKGI
jgi:hypothetical protein